MYHKKIHLKIIFHYTIVEWTVSLTKFMQECAWRISNETPFSRHDSMSGQPSQVSHVISILLKCPQMLVHVYFKNATCTCISGYSSHESHVTTSYRLENVCKHPL